MAAPISETPNPLPPPQVQEANVTPREAREEEDRTRERRDEQARVQPAQGAVLPGLGENVDVRV